MTQRELQELLNTQSVVNLHGATVVIKGSPLQVNQDVLLECGKIRRGKTGRATLISDLKAGDTKIIVDNPHDFKIGDWVLVVNSKRHLDNSGVQIGQVKDIEDNQITTHQSHTKSMPRGSLLIHQFPLIRTNNRAALHCRLITFDGNKHENDYTYDWRYNHTVSINTGSIIEHCIFTNTPCENIFACGGIVRYNIAKNLNGSFVHFSCSQAEGARIENNTIDSVCLIELEINGHNEGCFSYSANTIGNLIINNYCRNGGEGCFGVQGLDDYSNQVIDNYFENFARKITIVNNHPMPENIEQNTFVNVCADGE